MFDEEIRKKSKKNEPTDHSAECSSFMHLNHNSAG